MHVYICLGPFIPDYQYSCLHLQSLYAFLHGILCARKINIILNISMKDVHDFVENSLTLIFLFALP